MNVPGFVLAIVSSLLIPGIITIAKAKMVAKPALAFILHSGLVYHS